MTFTQPTTRRTALSLLATVLAAPARAREPTDGRLRFAVFRNRDHVGEQAMRFVRASGLLTVTTDVGMTIRLGPVPVFRYAHHAVETLRGGRFERLESATSSNGKAERVLAVRSADAVRIETARGALAGPAELAPFTHWDSSALQGPLFNPQTGQILKVSATRHAADELPVGSALATGTRWAVRGEAYIDDWYDAAGVWAALRGKLPDGSIMTYRRL